MSLNPEDRSARRDPEALLRQRRSRRAGRAPRPVEDLSRLRVRRRQVLSAVRRRPPASRARRGRRGGGAPAGYAAGGRRRGRDARDHSHARGRRRSRDRRAGRARTASDVCAWSTGWRTTIRRAAATRSGTRTSKNCSTAGISVLTSINLEYVAEQQEFVRERARHGPTPRPCRRPSSMRADDVVVVDAPPEAETTWQSQQLSSLRQRALLLTADVVDRPARGVPAGARHPHVLGHAGAHPGLHDPARERRERCSRAAGATRIAFTASCSPST